MNRIKDIKDVIVSDSQVLAELITPKRQSGIIVEENLSNKQTNQYCKIIAVGSAITDLQPGDIIVRTRIDKAPAYDYKDKNLVIFARYDITIAVKPSNFEESEELVS